MGEREPKDESADQPAAEDDLARIYGRIAISNPEAAKRFRSEAEKALNLLGKHPQLGPRPGWPTRHPRLRFWVISRFHSYLIYYEPGEDAVSVERVLDGRRDVRRIYRGRCRRTSRRRSPSALIS